MSHISLPPVNRDSLWESWAFDAVNELHFLPAPLQAETRARTTPAPNSDLDTHLEKTLLHTSPRAQVLK